ncbi:MAG TPA: hypothetical protein VIT65_00715 [Microlunatus sp.]
MSDADLLVATAPGLRGIVWVERAAGKSSPQLEAILALRTGEVEAADRL